MKDLKDHNITEKNCEWYPNQSNIGEPKLKNTEAEDYIKKSGTKVYGRFEKNFT